jgi:hypothetical protein
LASNADEGRGTLRYASRNRVQMLYSRMSEWGNPPEVYTLVLLFEHIGQQRERGELKHLSSLRKRNNSPSSGERKGTSPNRDLIGRGVVGLCG